jgi:beta-glucanase (GH16 family)
LKSNLSLHVYKKDVCTDFPFCSAAWMMPAKNAYGVWPMSGEIDITESRGNQNLMLDGKNIGTEMSGSTLHFGPFDVLNAYEKGHFETSRPAGQGFDKDFHNFQLEWTPGKEQKAYLQPKIIARQLNTTQKVLFNYTN